VVLLGGEHSEAAHRPGLSGSPDFALFPPAAGFPADSANREGFQPLGPRIRALLIWPKVPPSFWNPQGTPGLKETSQIPPLGLLTIAALCPKNWTIRLIDQMVENLLDEDIRDADLVMVSGMQVQRQAIQEVLVRARALGKRTIIGGPYASSEPESVLPLADHVVIGEPDAEFARIAADLENGSARRLYDITEKPDVTGTPIPRFDLLKLERYACMAVQFSRGCPFQCEFCDIITIYGRKPRTKYPAQVIAELQTLFELGARKPVFIVDDNFIGNHKRALELALELRKWSGAHDHPFPFHTEASIDLAQRPALIDAMVKANFFGVFVGIESPSRESLLEAKKLQNLRCDPLESIQVLQDKGLWVTGGFIIGFDSDSEDIFECQRDFIERAAIPWAMLGFLQAPPTTPLYQRMLKEGRLLDGGMVSNFHPPNFRTLLPLPVLLRGVQETLQSLYAPSAFYDRCLRSLIAWKPQGQKPPAIPFLPILRALLSLLWCQGIRSDYRRQWWKFLFELLRRWSDDPLKRWWACTLLVSGHHFIRYARAVAEQLEGELRKLGTEGTGRIEGHGGSQAGTEAARVIFAPAVQNSRASNLPGAGSA
jgi:radical SAM superfamily enzyme YgiQ (UPF0313 family)